MTRSFKICLKILFFVFVLSLGAESVKAQTFNLCDRTPQVRRAIIGELTGVTDTCDDGTPDPMVTVNAIQLEGIIHLNLSDPTYNEDDGTDMNNMDDIMMLLSGDFVGLTNLEALDLSFNQLSDLPSGVFDTLTSLISLTLVENALSDLRSGVFDNLINLTFLNLGGNELSNLRSGVFDNLTNLRELYLWDNELSNLRSGVFDNLINLEVLWLGGNQLRNLPSRVFDNLTNLRDLSLDNNQLSDSDLPSGVFDTLTSLRWLDLSSNRLSDLRGLFDTLTSLRGLDLGSNRLSDLPDGIFSGLTSLTALSVTSNPDAPFSLTLTPETVSDTSFQVVVAKGAPYPMMVTATLTGTTFTDGSNTRRITVQTGRTTSDTVIVNRTGNTPVQVTLSAPSSLPALGTEEESVFPTQPTLNIAYLNSQGLTIEDLDLLENFERIRELDAEALFDDPVGFRGLETAADPSPLTLQNPTTVNICDRTRQVRNEILEQLGLTETNACATVPTDRLATIPRLDLFDKSIASLHSEDFAGLTSLTELVLEENQLTELPSGIFSSLTRLMTLNLFNNQLTTPMVPSGIFDELTELRVLDLGLNQLTTPLPAGIFNRLTNLTDLGLYNNQLTELPAGIFNTLGNLRVLGLNNNSLERLPDRIFSDLGNLRVLGLDNNSLERLPDRIFSDLGNLRVLGLDNNSLERLPDRIFSDLGSLEGVIVGERDENGTVTASLPLTVTLRDTSQGMAEVVVTQGVPFTSVTVTLSITGGTFSNNNNDTTTVTIMKGETESSFAFTVDEPTPETPVPEAVIRITDISSQPEKILDGFVSDENSADFLSGYSGFRFEPVESVPPLTLEGICSRTIQVQQAILRELREDDCMMVTSDQLARMITGTLTLSSVTSLKSGDFAGLSGLQILNLPGNGLMSLPPGVFSGLSALTSLDLSNNGLMSLPPGVFSGLSALTSLDVSDNDLMSLPSGVFSGLTMLTGVNASGNPDIPFTLTLELRETGMNSFVIEVAEGAPTER